MLKKKKKKQRFRIRMKVLNQKNQMNQKILEIRIKKSLKNRINKQTPP